SSSLESLHSTIRLLIKDRLTAVDLDAVDLVHLHGIWVPYIHTVLQVALSSNIPVVLSPHGMLAPAALRHKAWKKKLAWSLYQKKDLRMVQAFHATSKHESIWIRNKNLTQPILEVPLGSHLPPTLPPILQEKRYVGFLGRLHPIKNLEILIKAWSKLE